MSIRNIKTKIVVASGAVMASGSALADNTAAITEAVTNGEALVQLTTGGVISIAAICFGVGLVASMLIKR
ncbi:hypothetical protein ACP6H1_24020 [Vibrio harveyi]|uniref:hypothetical protein n=1 Tax=Vibrio harveyi TaxID=669 RepID=UPI003CF6D8F9|nr:hypothetical protein [Vibrio parahaemolyticus]